MNETSLTLQAAARLLWKHKFSCIGRMTRTEFWLSEILLVITSLCISAGIFLLMFLSLSIYEGTLFAGVVSLFLLFILGLIGFMLFILQIILCIRRLHDIGKSGWWAAIIWIPVMGQVILLILTARLSDGKNQYGPPVVY